MKYAFAHFKTAVGFIKAYNGNLPLAIFLKQQFALSKKFGSKDRRNITQLCYAFFRAGKAFQHLSVEDALLQALAIQPHVLINWSALIPANFQTLEWDGNSIFPFVNELSKEIDSVDFSLSHLHQPKVYLRCRPDKANKVRAALLSAGIEFTEEGGEALSVAPGANLEKAFDMNRDAVVQDYSSQQVGSFFKTLNKMLPTRASVWDCCAASGGKSILAADILDRPCLTVSDIRPTILHNLHHRLAAAGISIEKSFVADLSESQPTIDTFDLVICDVPCSGSGTWSRTPEQLYFFTNEKMKHYVELQQKIVHNVLPSVKPNGFLLYLTCSVFHAENEDQVEVLLNSGEWELIEQRLFTGYHRQADTLFGALLRKK